jgi:hypothetical protein
MLFHSITFVSCLLGYSLFLLAYCINTSVFYNAVNISQAAYCMTELDSWTCYTCSNNFIYETKLEKYNELVIFGYDTIYHSIFIGFRGSSNIQNWISNIKIILIHPYADNSIAVDKGFYDLYDILKPDVMSIISDMTRKYATNKLFITGHSLGGALATICSFDIMYNEFPYDISYLITFGSPRVGNVYFSDYFNAYSIYSKRITHNYDIVPHVPEEFLGYKHVSNEIWYNEDNTEYTICNDLDNEDPTCSNSCAPTKCTSTSDHLNYLNISMGNDGFC